MSRWRPSAPRGVARRLRGLLCDGRQPPREGGAVLDGDAAVGVVTSGNFSPVLERGIALAFLPPGAADGDPFAIDVARSQAARRRRRQASRFVPRTPPRS